MDGLDIRILDALQQDGSLTQEQLAERVGSSPSTSLRRARRLKASGHLSRCVYLADSRKLDRGLRTIITVVTSGNGGKTGEALARKVRNEPAIDLAYVASGRLELHRFVDDDRGTDEIADELARIKGFGPYVLDSLPTGIVHPRESTCSNMLRALPSARHSLVRAEQKQLIMNRHMVELSVSAARRVVSAEVEWHWVTW